MCQHCRALSILQSLSLRWEQPKFPKCLFDIQAHASPINRPLSQAELLASLAFHMSFSSQGQRQELILWMLSIYTFPVDVLAGAGPATAQTSVEMALASRCRFGATGACEPGFSRKRRLHSSLFAVPRTHSRRSSTSSRAVMTTRRRLASQGWALPFLLPLAFGSCLRDGDIYISPGWPAGRTGGYV